MGVVVVLCILLCMYEWGFVVPFVGISIGPFHVLTIPCVDHSMC